MQYIVSAFLNFFLFAGLLLVSASFFLCQLIKVVKRWKKGKLSLWTKSWYVLVLLLPSVVFLPAMVQDFVQEIPVSRAELITVTAPIQEIHQYTKRQISRSPGNYYTYTYAISLSGYPGWFHIPQSVKTDKNALLSLADDGSLTCLYTNKSGKNVLYEIQRKNGENYFTYQDVVWDLEVSAYWSLFVSLCLFLWGVGLLLLFPFILFPTTELERLERNLVLIFIASIASLILIAIIIPKLSVKDIVPSQPLVVSLDDSVQISLPNGWEKGKKDGNITWYEINREVASCFHVEDFPHDPEVSEPYYEDWCQITLAAYRRFLLGSFIKDPWEEQEPFLSDLVPYEFASGEPVFLSSGWGISNGGTKNHILVLLLPEQRQLISIHSSSWDMDWGELETYVDGWILPLLDQITLL